MTLTELKARLALYLAAEVKILEGNQSWSSPDGMTYTRANINALQRGIRDIQAQIDFAESAAYQCQSITFNGRR